MQVPVEGKTVAPPAAQVADLMEARERLARVEGELTGVREALRLAEAEARTATQRAEKAEAAALEAWRTTAELARQHEAPPETGVSVQAPASPRKRGWPARLFG